MIKRFFIYGLLGWNIEIIWTGMYSLLSGNWGLPAFTNLWMFFVYGLAVLLEPVHDIIKEWRLPVRGVIWVVIIWGIEYSTGLILKSVIGQFPWIYDGNFAVDGLVRLDYAPAWFAAGLVFERIHKTLDSYRIS